MALLGTGFTYQGQLKKDGLAVSGDCEMAFRLYDAASAGNAVGSPITRTVTISAGFFTEALDFGAGAFNGDARWLAISVQCVGDGVHTALSRQALTPAPYALALPGLYTQQHATSPNLIGGYSGNWVTGGVYGATIGGGGDSSYANRVTDSYGTVGGGAGNQAGDNAGSPGDKMFATVGGGEDNTASGDKATVGGGELNIASGISATIGGGWNNTAIGNYATIAGGYVITASGLYATVGGGQNNVASGDAATVGGGQFNDAGNNYATIGGGNFNTTSSNYATIGGGNGNTAAYAATVAGGSYNTASSSYATVPGGVYAQANHYGQMAYASGRFDSTGDAQTSLYVMRREASMPAGTWYNLYLDGSIGLLTIASGRAMAFDILIVGRTEAGESAGYRIEGVIENVGGTTAFIGGTPTPVLLGEDDAAWNVRVVANTTDDSLHVEVMGNNETIRWVATVRTAEVGW